MTAKKKTAKKSKTVKTAGEPNFGGRPRLYETPEEFESKVFEYQAHCKETKEPVTWTGLALFLGFSSRQAINMYEDYDGFYDVVKRAKLFVEYNYEIRVNGNNATGPIFVLKNMGWSDKQQIEHTEKIKDSGEDEW